MLHTLLRYILLPVLALFLLTYAAFPWWLPLAAQLIEPAKGLEIQELNVGYPNYNRWQIHNLKVLQTSPTQDTQLQFENMQLSYNLVDLWHGGLPNIDIAKATFETQLAQSSLDTTPIMILLPQRWLQNMPEQVNIERVIGNISSPNTPLGGDFDVIGKFDASPKQAHAVAKLMSRNAADLFFEATLADDNAIAATLFTKQQSAPIAKLTSQMRQAGEELNWQGQMALNVPVMQKLFANLIPPRFALPVEQGRLMSHWQVNVPTDQRLSVQRWLQSAYGEHQIQLQLQTNSTVAKDIVLDTNITHYLGNGTRNHWQINAGSQLSLKPNWTNLNLQSSTIDSLALNNLEMRVTAQGPIGLAFEKHASNLFEREETLVLDGILNATLQSPEAQYQIFSQLSELRYNNTDAWRGKADLSGYYMLPQQHPLLQQIPLGMQQVQALAQFDFTMAPNTWHIDLAPNSKLSANQVESQLQQSQVLLFASDRLNLVNSENLQLTYHTTDNQWQWNNIKLSLHPQTSTGTEQAKSRALGLQIQLPAGRSQFNNRPSEGFFQLHAKDTRLRGWPEFDLLGEGSFTFGNDELAVDFTGQAQPFADVLNGQLAWDLVQHQGRLDAIARDIDLVTLQQRHPINWPLQVSTGSFDYEGTWQWQTQQKENSQHLFDLHDIDGIGQSFDVRGMSGQIEVQTKPETIDTHYELQVQELQPKVFRPELEVLSAQIKLHTSSPANKGIAKAMNAPSQWTLDQAQGQLLQGHIQYQQDSWQVRDMDLARLAPLLWPNLHAKGSLSGDLQFNQQWLLQGMNLSNDKPIELHLQQPIPLDTPGADTFNQLLQNMQVSNLTITSEESEQQYQIPANVRLQGSSATFNDNQAVDLNLTVLANLKHLYQVP